MSKPAPTPVQLRAHAARDLLNILYRGKTLDQTFGNSEVAALERELVNGTLRYLKTLARLVDRHLQRDLKTRDLDLRCLLLVGAYQLHYTRIPDHAVLNETVSACRALRKPWARGLLNAVLRNLLRAKDQDAFDIQNEQSFELPEWIETRLKSRYPESVLKANLERAPMALRVNLARIDSKAYRDRLAAAGITCRTGYFAESVILETPIPVRRLPGFSEGLVSVQDPGALFVAHLLEEIRAGRILDACAAPGGKLFHLAELGTSAELTGLEQSAERLTHMREEAARLGHDRIHCVAGDATLDDWFAGEPFDAILVDAPCTGSGTLRRHPDIKWLRRETDLERYSALQRRLVQNLWPLLKPGGTLLYCTCSLFEEENDAVIASLLLDLEDARLEPVSLPVGMATSHGWQLYPLPSELADGITMDGFFFARLSRRAHEPTTRV